MRSSLLTEKETTTMRDSKPQVQKVLSLAGYKHALHTADVAILTLSTTSHDYMLVDGAIQQRVRSYTPIVVEHYPRDFMGAHRALMLEIQDYAVWMLLAGTSYPTWAMATLLQVQGAQEATRIFMVRYPVFGLQEFLLD